MRGFVRGILWGSLAAAGGLVVVSQLAGPAPETVANLPDAPAAAVDMAIEEPAAPVADVAKPDAVTEAPASPQGATATTAPEVPAAAEAPATAVQTADAPAAPAPEPAVTPPAAPVEPPAAPPSVAPEAGMAATSAEPQPVAPVASPDLPAATVPAAPGQPAGETAPQSAELPPPPPLTPEEEALLMPLPEAPAKPAAPKAIPDPTPEPGPIAEPVPEVAQDPAPQMTAKPEAPATLTPEPGLQSEPKGVVTGRLPRIGDSPATAPADQTAAAGDDPAQDENMLPLQRFARPFANTAQKPLFAILLQDDGQDGVNRAELAALDLPLTIVIDPLSDGAAERAAIWRAGGQEVVMAGTGIPEGAGPGDLEQSFQVLASRLPDSVAVIDADGTAFQNNRPLATQVVPILAAQGRGLVTFDQGLNAADQVARRENLAAATIFRRIDGEGEASPVIQRYLDRAAFKAAQEGRVVVIGDLRAETVAGILEWTVEGRASTVALAPITALLAR